MGYSKSIKALKKVTEYLDQMVASSSQITWQDDMPNDLAFAIRQGINIAKKRALAGDSPNQATFAEYSRLSAKYIIRVGVGVVIAEPREVLLDSPKQTVTKQVLPELTTDMEIVGAAIVHKTPVMFFPDAPTDSVPLKFIHTWAQKNGYYLVSSEDGLTLTKTDPGEIAWTPAQEQA